MIILRAIGRFFARIGRWIRDTAWVQPLLIVGGIFAIIFCIKPISNAVSGWFQSGNEAVEFYKSYKVSMLKNNAVKDSDADKLISRIEKGEIGKDEKFFLSFVKEDCENCKSCYEGFVKLREEWTTGNLGEKMTGSFKMYTIFIDEKNDDGELMIDDLINSHLNFFSSLNTSFIENCDADAYYYYRNMSSSNQSSYISQLEALGDTIGAREEEEAEGFVAPTTYLVDGGTVDPDYVIYEQITQCLFNYTTDVEGSTDFNKAYFLRDCWNYKGVFSRDYKPKN